MKILVVFLVIFLAYSQAISYQALVQEQWENFKLTHRKLYATEDEEQYRQKVFMENLLKIASHNKLYEMGLSSFKMAMNEFGDLTGEEFLRFYTVDMSEEANRTDFKVWGGDLEDPIIYAPPANVDDADLEDEMDWRRRGAVTAVRNQGQCGSCWSFSAVGSLEGQWFRKTGRLVPLSEQNLVDCSGGEGNHGCNGGWMTSAFNYVRKNGGIDTDSSYPYEGRVDRCRFDRRHVGATVSQSISLAQGEYHLKAAVSSVGPISVAIQVISSFQHYGGGVYDDASCGYSINHAVLAVGYGNERGKDYWLVKNSWGNRWGEGGYIKMVRNRNGQCGIAQYASYPRV